MKVYIVILIALALAGCDAKRGPIQMSDETSAKTLIGRWTAEMTNRVGVCFTGDVTYGPDGSVLWRGSLIETNGIRREFADTGWWRIQSGYLVTKVTNSTFRSLIGEPEFRDELVSVSATQFTYRDDHGGVYTRVKKP